MRDTDVVTRLNSVGYEVGTMKRDAFAICVRAEVTKWARIAKETGAKAE